MPLYIVLWLLRALARLLGWKCYESQPSVVKREIHVDHRNKLSHAMTQEAARLLEESGAEVAIVTSDSQCLVSTDISSQILKCTEEYPLVKPVAVFLNQGKTSSVFSRSDIPTSEAVRLAEENM